MTPTILFRVDGDDSSGLGHLSRCIGLCEALSQQGAQCQFLGSYSANGEALLNHSNIKWDHLGVPSASLQDLERLNQRIMELQAQAIIVDSYKIDSSFIKSLCSQTTLKVLIDDSVLLSSYEADIIINSTIGAERISYPLGSTHKNPPKILAGLAYFLFRQELAKLRQTAVTRPDVKDIAVAISGDSHLEVSEQVVRGITDFFDSSHVRTPPHVNVFVPQNSGETPVNFRALAGHGLSIQFTAFNPMMVKALRDVDIVICSGGLTKYESLFLGKPTLTCARNAREHEDTREFALNGALIDMGLAVTLKPDDVKRALTRLLGDGQFRRQLSQHAYSMFIDESCKNVAIEILAAATKKRM